MALKTKPGLKKAALALKQVLALRNTTDIKNN